VTMKICVDLATCAGHAVCESLDEDVFRLGEDGYIRLLTEHPSEDKREVMEDAVNQCPTGALSIQDP
jgi:ferredoxin